jgi:hypothetical protein
MVSIFKAYFSSTDTTTITDTLSTYLHGYAVQGGFIYCNHCNTITITSCTFESSIAKYGGAIMFDHTSYVMTTEQVAFTATACTFKSN